MKKNRKKAPRTKDPEVKVVIVGDAEAGKSALLERIGLDTFRSVYKETIGMDFMRHPMPPPPAEHTALWSMWDMGGSEKFDSLAESYCTGANVGLVVHTTPHHTHVASLSCAGAGCRRTHTHTHTHTPSFV